VEFSVVIPTYNRAGLLANTLEALARQAEGAASAGGSDPISFETIVVDDGSSDDTEARVEEIQRAFPAPLIYLRQSNRKQGAARNLGVGRAQGDFVVFIGDDTVPAPDFLVEHRRARRSYGESAADSKLVVIGYTRWAERLERTRFMQYIGEQGWQFGFSLIQDPTRVPFNFFYTSNISLSRCFFLESGGFDEGFQEYGWEDIELSLRLERRGMKLVYHPAAVAYHDHPTSLGSFIGRQRRVGYSAWSFYRRHPEMAGFLNVLRARPYAWSSRARMAALTALCRLTERRSWPDLSRYYPDLMSYYYNLGILEARHEHS
jgi:GT2 family glycosyltransferase